MKKPLKFKYFTPKPGYKSAVFKNGEWVDVWPGETLMAHESFTDLLATSNLIPCPGPTVYKTIRDLKARRSKNFKSKILE